MTLLEEILHANASYDQDNFNKNTDYKLSSKPLKKALIITCIDCRLVDLLEKALGIQRGEFNILKTAGNYVSSSIDDTVKSILVAIYELEVQEIFIIGHYNCGVVSTNKKKIVDKMLSRNINSKAINQYKSDFGNWLDDYEDPKINVIESVNNLKNNPLIPENIKIHGLIINPDNGNLDLLVNGD